MTTRKRNRYSPDDTSHPGVTLREMMTERGVRQGELARLLGIAQSYLCDIMNGKRGVSVVTALRLEAALGITAEFWLTMQMNHDLAAARDVSGPQKGSS